VRLRPAGSFVLVVAICVCLSTIAWAGYRIRHESAPIARGVAYAGTKGCVECHGDPGNPLADANDQACSNVNRFGWHPDYSVDCADVMAYFEAIRLRRNIDDRKNYATGSPLIAGEILARKYHCFQCHGYLGQGGFKNARSLKGYVPGYFGADFKTLTRNANRESVRAWITHGVDSKMLDKPITGRIAAIIFSRQAVNMPSYKSLEPEEIETLVDYVIALNEIGPMNAKHVRFYGERSIAN